MKYREIEDYYRQSLFDFFSKAASPFYDVTFHLDVTRLVHGLGGGVELGLVVGHGVGQGRGLLLPAIFWNAGNMALPCARLAYGPEGLAAASVVFVTMASLTFLFGIWIAKGENGLAEVLRLPLIYAAAGGIGLALADASLPRLVMEPIEMVGAMAIPLMLITLGVAVARLHPSGLGQAVVLSLAKGAATVAIGWTIGRAFGLDDVAFAVLVLQVSTPVAVTSYMLAEKYGAESDRVAALVVTSTLTSVATIPLTLAFLV